MFAHTLPAMLLTVELDGFVTVQTSQFVPDHEATAEKKYCQKII
jgi:hypothetical protein